MSVPKVLVVGAVQGQLEKAFQKVSKLHLKQSFSFAILVGDVFASESTDESESQVKSLLDGSIKVPLPTYFTVGNHSLPTTIQERLNATDLGEVCENLIYLGRKGTLKTSEGIRIVGLGGKLVQNEAALTQAIGKYDALYTDSESRSLHGAHSADILITNEWPANITKSSQIPVPDSIDPASGTQSVANLCLALRPRYHFSSSPTAMWSREPFMIPAAIEGRQIKSYEDLDGPPAIVRFTGLASTQTTNKECLSAFTLDPNTPPSTEGASKTCPLATNTIKRKRDAETENIHRHSDDRHRDSRRRKHNNRARPQHTGACFMCTANPQFEDKMLVSIAEDSMLTVLKGPLPVRGTTFSHLKSSGHILIIPMYHAADEAAHGKRSKEELQREFDEMTRYRHGLQQMLASKGLGAVTWEVNRTGIRHFHWQLIACEPDKIKSGLVEAAYKVAAEKYKVTQADKETPVHFSKCEPESLLDLRSDFFRLWTYCPDRPGLSPVETADVISGAGLPDFKGTTSSMYFAIPGNMGFNIAFGREVMAGIMQLEDRSDWRALETGGDIEVTDALAWQDEFQRPFGEDRPGWDFAMS